MFSKERSKQANYHAQSGARQEIENAIHLIMHLIKITQLKRGDCERFQVFIKTSNNECYTAAT